MIKLLLAVVALSMLFRWALGKWPWDYLRSAPPRQQAVTNARKLLGVSQQADRREIREAHRNLAAMLHPDRGGDMSKMQELNAARDLLLAELPYDVEEQGP
ncbi:MAG: molecular chaperone DnaJ [Citromicrobium sp.]|nr:MAG: molecular chaperone DnaJ [Citromicrobium sp.]